MAIHTITGILLAGRTCSLIMNTQTHVITSKMHAYLPLSSVTAATMKINIVGWVSTEHNNICPLATWSEHAVLAYHHTLGAQQMIAYKYESALSLTNEMTQRKVFVRRGHCEGLITADTSTQAATVLPCVLNSFRANKKMTATYFVMVAGNS